MSDELASLLECVDKDNSYRVLRELNTSQVETTQLVASSDPNDTHEYVRKYFNADSGMGSAYLQLFQASQKGRTFARLPHVVDYYQLHDRHVVVMDYVPGETLFDLVYRLDPSPELASQVFGSVCDAATELHTSFDPPLIHRDLKPGNIVMGADGATLIDFGIARFYRQGAEGDTSHFGTPAFAPPEQFGFGQTDVRSDVYALGMVLYYLLTEKHANNVVREAQFVDPKIPEPFRQVISKATEFDPSARYQTAAELKSAFEEAVRRWKGAPARPASNSSVVTPSFDSPNKPTSRFAFKIPTPLGIAWNLAVAASWFLLMIGCVGACVTPTGEDIGKPLGYLAFVYFGAALIISGVSFILFDKRRLRERFPCLRRFTWWKQWVALFVMLCVLVFVLYVVQLALGIS